MAISSAGRDRHNPEAREPRRTLRRTVHQPVGKRALSVLRTVIDQIIKNGDQVEQTAVTQRIVNHVSVGRLGRQQMPLVREVKLQLQLANG